MLRACYHPDSPYVQWHEDVLPTLQARVAATATAAVAAAATVATAASTTPVPTSAATAISDTLLAAIRESASHAAQEARSLDAAHLDAIEAVACAKARLEAATSQLAACPDNRPGRQQRLRHEAAIANTAHMEAETQAEMARVAASEARQRLATTRATLDAAIAA